MKSFKQSQNTIRANFTHFLPRSHPVAVAELRDESGTVRSPLHQVLNILKIKATQDTI
jgi:hypothetical protein